jgi:hypothetical protein
MPKPFQAIPGPFGKTDEQATTNAFEEYVGGVRRAQRLLYIYNNSYPMPGRWTEQVSKDQVFRSRAKREGFTDAEIDAFFVVSR